jgi:hypothetical protein
MVLTNSLLDELGQPLSQRNRLGKFALLVKSHDLLNAPPDLHGRIFLGGSWRHM